LYLYRTEPVSGVQIPHDPGQQKKRNAHRFAALRIALAGVDDHLAADIGADKQTKDHYRYFMDICS
jgi:hypothetical protein